MKYQQSMNDGHEDHDRQMSGGEYDETIGEDYEFC
jgi:hypothetical protein